VSAIVRSGLGVAERPQLRTDPQDPRIALHPLVPPIPDREISIAWRAARTLSPTAERFVDLAVASSGQVAGQLSA
jgi:DNA-binding transcriptional LysR family regulator